VYSKENTSGIGDGNFATDGCGKLLVLKTLHTKLKKFYLWWKNMTFLYTKASQLASTPYYHNNVPCDSRPWRI